ncbi:Phage related protein [Leptospirillum ferriphilum]|uniref:Phage related protein n=3 Tax=Leptospirillum ferriphilum TaxID=178606 RepID=A0A094W8J1_9BACT|nr:ERF family protein [Leptospirillum ferriphilum]KGA93853.1 Phage related protein [Leptospirillum ferriphilum]
MQAEQSINVVGDVSVQAGRDPGFLDSLLQNLFLSDAKIELIERVIQLREEFIRSEREKKVAFDKALSACQAEIPAIHKNRTVSYKTRDGKDLSYSYATKDAILDVVRPIMGKHSLAFTYDVLPSRDKPNVLVVTGKLRHVDGHEEVSSFECFTNSFEMRNPAQSLASIETFASRYVFNRMLNISTGEDTDANIDDGKTSIGDRKSSSSSQDSGSIDKESHSSPKKGSDKKAEDLKRFEEFSGVLDLAIKKKDSLLLETAIPIGASISSPDLKVKARALMHKAKSAIQRPSDNQVAEPKAETDPSPAAPTEDRLLSDSERSAWRGRIWNAINSAYAKEDRDLAVKTVLANLGVKDFRELHLSHVEKLQFIETDLTQGSR